MHSRARRLITTDLAMNEKGKVFGSWKLEGNHPSQGTQLTVKKGHYRRVLAEVACPTIRERSDLSRKRLVYGKSFVETGPGAGTKGHYRRVLALSIPALLPVSQLLQPALLFASYLVGIF